MLLERQIRTKYVGIFYYIIPLISLIAVSFVKEDLKRLRYKLKESVTK